MPGSPVLARSHLLLTFAVTLAVACTPRPTSLPPPDGEPSFPADPQMLEECRAITSRLRGLEFTTSTSLARIDSKTLAQRVSRGVDNALPPSTLEHLQLELFAFGLIPADFDLRAYVKTLNTDQLAGYYDSRRKRLVLLQDGTAATPSTLGVATPAEPGTDAGGPAEPPPITEEKLSLVHELVHTLQDQNLIGLHNFLHPSGAPPLAGDEEMARRALLEGDATFVMTQYNLGAEQDLSQQNAAGTQAFESLRHQIVADARELGSGPRFFLDQLLFSYLYGMDFVARLLRERGWEVVNAAYRWPPSSTEHIFHPSKYLEGELPHHVILSPIPGLENLGYTPAGEGAWGELGIRSLLANARGWDEAADAAAGWGGDRFRIFRKTGNSPLVVWATSWDTQHDAEEFATALELYRQARTIALSHLEWERRGSIVLAKIGGGPEAGLSSLWGAVNVERQAPEIPPFVGDLLR